MRLITHFGSRMEHHLSDQQVHIDETAPWVPPPKKMVTGTISAVMKAHLAASLRVVAHDPTIHDRPPQTPSWNNFSLGLDFDLENLTSGLPTKCHSG